MFLSFFLSFSLEFNADYHLKFEIERAETNETNFSKYLILPILLCFAFIFFAIKTQKEAIENYHGDDDDCEEEFSEPQTKIQIADK